jgi:tellurite resistance protein TehA-like permease
MHLSFSLTVIRWFLTTMGTGIVSVLLHQLPYQFAGLAEISIVFLFITIILFVTLFTLSIIRYTLWPEIFGLMLRHPVESLFLYSPLDSLITEDPCQWGSPQSST